MRNFPATPAFTDLNEPVGVECVLRDLAVDGTIPPDLRGAFVRAVPDPAFPPLFADDSVLSGDGMVSKLEFRDDGTVDFAIRYVDTVRHKAERAAGRALYGRYRNPFTDDPSVAGTDRTVANTTPVWHAGRLLMTKEDGRAYRIDPATLDTIGSYDFAGALRSETMTAHARIDPATGEMFFFGYEAAGLASTKIAYCIADPHGRLARETWFDAPYCGMMHDFAITESWALFPVFPTTASLDRLKSGGEHWVHEQALEAWVAIMPRQGDPSRLRWFRGPKGVSAYHVMNAFEDAEGRIHLDLCLSDTNAFPFIREASGIARPQSEIGSRLARWTIEPEGADDTLVETPLGPPGDMPRIADADQGRPYVRAWLLGFVPNGGPPLFGGPVGICFNTLYRLAPGTLEIRSLILPPGHAISEPVHVPSREPGHGGWLLAIVDRQTGPNAYEHAAWVIAADDIEAGPVAQVHIPHRLRPQVHGTWVPADQLRQAKGA
ncbi:MAG TPA: carotenoid oxygenase family protein [Stellaceae bacterium]|nr:carotenoid oxygenase family protein [Stellaceae bacterium]